MEWIKASLSIDGIDVERGGEVCVYVFLNKGFPVNHDDAEKMFCSVPTGPTMQMDIQVPDEPFAIKIHHDEDESGTVTKNWTGFIPAEGLGFSSGAKLGFGPPSFEDAATTLPEDGQITIEIIYP